MHQQEHGENSVDTTTEETVVGQVKLQPQLYHPESCCLPLTVVDMHSWVKCLLQSDCCLYLTVSASQLDQLCIEEPETLALYANIEQRTGPWAKDYFIRSGDALHEVKVAAEEGDLPSMQYRSLNLDHTAQLNARQILSAAQTLLELERYELAAEVLRKLPDKLETDLIDQAISRALWAGDMALVEKLCMQLPANHLSDSSLYIELAKHWQSAGNTIKVESWLRKSEQSAGNSAAAWCSCAEIWREMRNRDEVIRCLQWVEGNASDVTSLTWCARIYQSLSLQHDAMRCLTAAENIAIHSTHWEMIGKQWFSWGSNENAFRCLRTAEKRASGVSFVRMCALGWQDIQAPDEAVRCQKSAERQARQCSDYLDCACGWGQLGRWSEVKSCIIKAETLAQDAYDWQKCAEAWHICGCGEEAVRCESKASSLSATMRVS